MTPEDEHVRDDVAATLPAPTRKSPIVRVFLPASTWADMFGK